MPLARHLQGFFKFCLLCIGPSFHQDHLGRSRRSVWKATFSPCMAIGNHQFGSVICPTESVVSGHSGEGVSSAVLGKRRRQAGVLAREDWASFSFGAPLDWVRFSTPPPPHETRCDSLSRKRLTALWSHERRRLNMIWHIRLRKSEEVIVHPSVSGTPQDRSPHENEPRASERGRVTLQARSLACRTKPSPSCLAVAAIPHLGESRRVLANLPHGISSFRGIFGRRPLGILHSQQKEGLTGRRLPTGDIGFTIKSELIDQD